MDESASADHEAAAAFSGELKTLVEEVYLPQQVFNADETGLFWKKMAKRTFISKYEEKKKAPGFKAAKDRLTLLLCGNVAGYKCKPMLVYKSENPRALKGRNKSSACGLEI